VVVPPVLPGSLPAVPVLPELLVPPVDEASSEPVAGIAVGPSGEVVTVPASAALSAEEAVIDITTGAPTTVPTVAAAATVRATLSLAAAANSTSDM
jgi:hypothetical protein